MNARGERIIIFGDSLSHHGRDADPEIWDVDAGSNRQTGQPGDLVASLLAEQGAEAVRVNARVGRSAVNFWGRENASALLDSDRAFKPTKVIVILGTNDIGVTLPKTVEAMTAIRDVYRSMGAEVWGVGPFMYASDDLNQRAVPVVEAMTKIFGKRFIDPRPITTVVGRSGDGVHFSSDSARQTGIQLADQILSTPSPKAWMPYAIGAGLMVVIGLAWSWKRNPSKPLFGLDMPDLGELKPVHKKEIKAYVTKARKALRQLETATAKQDASMESLAELADQAHGELFKAREAIENHPAFVESYEDDDPDVAGVMEELEESNAPDGDEVRYEAKSFQEAWKDSMKRFEDSVSNVEDSTQLEGLGELGINKNVSFHELIKDPDPAAMDIAEDMIMERGWKLREVTGGIGARAFTISMEKTGDIGDPDRWKSVQTAVDETTIKRAIGNDGRYHGTWANRIKKINGRWQPVSELGYIIQSSTVNADGTGYKTKKAAEAAAKELRAHEGASAARIEVRAANGAARVTRTRIVIGIDKDEAKKLAVADAWAIAKAIKPLPLDTPEEAIAQIVDAKLQKPENMTKPELFGLGIVDIVDGKRWKGSTNELIRSGAREVECKSGLVNQARCWTKKGALGELGAYRVAYKTVNTARDADGVITSGSTVERHYFDQKFETIEQAERAIKAGNHVPVKLAMKPVWKGGSANRVDLHEYNAMTKPKAKGKKSLGNANRALTPDEIMIAANDAALEGDYAKAIKIYKQRVDPPRIRTAYSVVTPESAEDGDVAERGWEDEDGEEIEIDEDDIEQLADDGSHAPVTDAIAVKAKGWLLNQSIQEASSSAFYPNVWYSATSDDEPDFGSSTERTYHLDDFTDDEKRRVYDKLAKLKHWS